MAKNAFLPIPANLDPAGPNFVAVLNDRLRRLATPATSAAGKTTTNIVETGAGGGISLGAGYFVITPSAGNATIDLANGPNQLLLLNGTAVTILAPIWTGGTVAAGNRVYLYLDQDATGGRAAPTFTLGAGAFASDTPAVVSPDSTPSTRTYLCFVFHGSIWALDGPQRTGGAIT
jgi:hypothetical protein